MTPRIVLDTNVLISGTLWSGVPAQVMVALSAGRVTLILSPSIIREYNVVLSRSEFTPYFHRLGISLDRLLEQLVTIAFIVEDSTSPQKIASDPSDEKFVAAAIAGSADVIISGDRHLLELKEVAGIPVLTPAQFLHRFRH